MKKTVSKIIMLVFAMFMLGIVVMPQEAMAVRPTINVKGVNSDGKTVNSGATIKVEMLNNQDGVALESYEYIFSVDGKKAKNGRQVLEAPVSYATVSFEVPNYSSEIDIYIEVRNENNEPAYLDKSYDVKYIDSTGPVIKMSEQSGSTLEPGTELQLTVTEKDTFLKYIEYQWTNKEEKTWEPEDGKVYYEGKISFPNIIEKPGKYVLTVTAKNAAGTPTTKTFTYYVEGEETEIEISADPKSGKIKADSEIDIFVESNKTLKKIQYRWDKDVTSSTKSYTLSGKEDSFTVTEVPTTTGSHKLYVLVTTADGETEPKTFSYTVTADTSDDDYPPELTITPYGGKIEAEGKISLKGIDAVQIAKMKYQWDSSSAKTLYPEDGDYVMTETIYAPTKLGEHTLTVWVYDEAGNYDKDVVEFEVVEELEEDDEKPTIEADPDEGTVEPEEKITVTVEDNEELKTVKYKWDSKSYTTKTITGKDEYEFTVYAPTTEGEHTLTVVATDKAGNTKTSTFDFEVLENSEEDDDEKPTITADPTKGEIEPKAKITLTVRDNEALKKVEYSWDNKTYTTESVSNKAKAEVELAAPSKEDDYTLYVKATDAAGNQKTEKFYYTVVDDDYNDDDEDPEVEADPDDGEVNANSEIKIKATDNEGLSKITYNWDDEDEETETLSGTSDSIDVEVPSDLGEHTLYVKVKDKAGNSTSEEFTYDVIDDEKPTISLNPKDGSKVNGGKVIKVTLKDNVELKKVTYNWEDEDKKTESISGTSDTISLPKLPNKEDTYKVTITVEDKAGNKRTETFKYYVEDDKDNDDEPTVEADPEDGTLEYGDKITIKAKDDGEIEYVEYYWDDDDDDTSKKYTDEFTVKVPSKEGDHTLYVRAMDDDDNLSDYEEFEYEIVENNYPGNSDIPGEINSKVKAVRVEIRNEDDKIRFMPEEDIIYYVDYYNGTSSDISNAKIEVELPTYLKATKASDKGSITTKKITWNLGKLEEDESGRISFTAHYTSDKYNEKVIVVTAKIYSGSKEKDKSTVRNMIYNEDVDGTGNHISYCSGYPDGTFKPQGNITRAELASMIANVSGIGGTTSKNQFTDTKNHWAEKYIQSVVDRGYMNPKAYNRFGAQDSATRADLAYAIAAILGVQDLEPIFIHASDTENSDVRCAMEQLLRLGIMDGYSDGTAKPNSYITRAETVTIINNYLFRGELTVKSFAVTNRFTDLSSGHWAYGQIMEATNSHRYERVTDGNEQML